MLFHKKLIEIDLGSFCTYAYNSTCFSMPYFMPGKVTPKQKNKHFMWLRTFNQKT